MRYLRPLALVLAAAALITCGGDAIPTSAPVAPVTSVASDGVHPRTSSAEAIPSSTAMTSLPSTTTLRAGSKTTATSTATTRPASALKAVSYQVSGGLAGTTDRLEILPDGRARYEGSRPAVTIQVPESTLAELNAALDAARLPSLASLYGRPRPDGFTYEIGYAGRSVSFFDGSIPPEIVPALTILKRELARAKS